MNSNKVDRILSFDGGGIKGLFSAYFMKFFCQDAGIPGNKIFEHFSVISGTSIGGIQALAYASGYSPDDMIELFLAQQNPLNDGSSNQNSIFYPPVSTIQKINTILYGEETWYQNTNLKALLNTKFGQAKMFQLKTNVLIPTVKIYTTQIPDVGTDIKAYRPTLYSNMRFNGLEGQNYLVQNVALATSAAPIYFPAVNIPEDTTANSKFIDGAVFQNNPTALEYALGNALNPISNSVCVLSVGTGLGTVGLFDPVPIPPPTLLQEFLNEFKEFLISQKNYTKTKIDLLVNSIIPNFENIYLLLDLLSLGISGPQEAINKMLSWLSLYGAKISNKDLFYYRFNTIYNPEQNTELDSTTADSLNYIKTAAEQQYNRDALKIQAFIQKCKF
jgi:predicted acylesterase/phospholipase RssA